MCCSHALGVNNLACGLEFGQLPVAVLYGQLGGSRRDAAAWVWQDPSFGGMAFADTMRDQKMANTETLTNTLGNLNPSDTLTKGVVLREEGAGLVNGRLMSSASC